MDHTVLLLKAPSAPEDDYAAALAAGGYETCFEPPLRFAFVQEEELRRRLERAEAYGGMVVTSPRGAAAVSAAIRAAPIALSAWKAMPVFVVGPATAAALRKLGLTPRGEETGGAEELADYILSAAPGDPLLFPCGNRRRDALPGRLRMAGIPLEELVVYRTEVVQDLDLSRVPRVAWVVCFSPSGVEALSGARGIDVASLRLAAIGRSTAEALEAQGWRVNAVADDPSPAGLVRSLLIADREEGPRAPLRSPT